MDVGFAKLHECDGGTYFQQPQHLVRKLATLCPREGNASYAHENVRPNVAKEIRKKFCSTSAQKNLAHPSYSRVQKTQLQK